MSSIVTITLNPAIDKSAKIKHLAPDKKLRTTEVDFEPGGGGINVSRAIHKLGGESHAYYAAGGHTGEFLTQLLDQELIRHSPVKIQDRTRENLMIFDESTQNQYRFGMSGAALTEAEAESFLQTIEKCNPAPEYVVASGSLPSGLPDNFYSRLGEVVAKTGARYIIDTSGAALKNGLGAGVYLLKPNLGELSQLVGAESLEGKMVEEAARELIANNKCEIVAVSLGPGGALLITKDTCERVASPTVHKLSTVGAGDSMVAGMVLSLARKKSPSAMIRYGVACGTAATITPGSELCRKEDVEKLYSWICEHSPPSN
jgi:6-phosphofructokinase 2